VEPRARPAATRGQQPCPDTASTTGKTGTRIETEHEDHNTPNKRKHLKSLVLVRHARRKESYVGNDSLDVLLCRR
jgi:hypothetical protein